MAAKPVRCSIHASTCRQEHSIAMKNKGKAASSIVGTDAQLEEKLAPLRKLTIQRPELGWIRAVREALEVTNTQLATRLGMQPQSVADIQAAEVAESIKIQTLRKVAVAL